MGTFNSNSKIWTNTVNSYSYPLDLFYGEKLLCALDETPDRILQINHEEGTSHSCEEIKISSIRVAQNLQRLGIETDNVIGLICRNSSIVISLIFGCVLIGAPVNPLHINFNKSKIQEIFEQTKPVLVFCDFDLFEITKNALKDINSNAIIYTLLKKVPFVPFINELLIPTGSEYHYKAMKFDNQASEKLIAIMCTSDSNGKLKGVCIPHTAILSYAEMKCRSMKEFRSLNFSSIHACVGIIGIFLSAFRPGETRISTNQSFTPKLCVELIEKYRVSVVAMPPIYLNALINSSFSQSGNFSSIVLFSCTGAILTENLREKFKKTFPNKPLLISYGKTEVFIGMFPGEDNNGLKFGRAFTNIQLKIVDEEGTALDLGEIGEILVKPEFKFQGYYKSPESTEEVVDRDGFIKTGDKGKKCP
jgi:acyl-CoA synthetase (AMP-forming)/AMP-acid ligase II